MHDQRPVFVLRLVKLEVAVARGLVQGLFAFAKLSNELVKGRFYWLAQIWSLPSATSDDIAAFVPSEMLHDR